MTCTEPAEVSESRELNPGRVLPKHVYYHYTTLRIAETNYTTSLLFCAVVFVKLFQRRIKGVIEVINRLAISID